MMPRKKEATTPKAKKKPKECPMCKHFRSQLRQQGLRTYDGLTNKVEFLEKENAQLLSENEELRRRTN